MITRACHWPFVWAGPGRADLKIVTGGAGPGRIEAFENVMGRVETVEIDGPGRAGP